MRAAAAPSRMANAAAVGGLALIVAGVGMLGVASSGASPASAAAPAAARAAAAPAAAPAARTAPGALLAFAGDTHFYRVTESRGTPHGLDSLRPLWSGADLVMLNLETAITTGGTREPKAYTFRAPASVLTTLHNAGVDAVTMANNHGVDYGAAGLRDSLAARASSPVPVLGIGRNRSDAFRPWLTEVKGERIAVFAADDVLDETTTPRWGATSDRAGVASIVTANSAGRAGRELLLSRVREQSRAGRAVVVYVHWGLERQSCPSSGMRTLVSDLSKAGADIIIGSHAHILLGAGYPASGSGGSTFVAYGAGNFVWESMRTEAERRSAVFQVRLHKGRAVSYSVRHARRATTGVPYAVSGAELSRATSAQRSLDACANLQRTPR